MNGNNNNGIEETKVKIQSVGKKIEQIESDIQSAKISENIEELYIYNEILKQYLIEKNQLHGVLKEYLIKENRLASKSEFLLIFTIGFYIFLVDSKKTSFLSYIKLKKIIRTPKQFWLYYMRMVGYQTKSVPPRMYVNLSHLI